MGAEGLWPGSEMRWEEGTGGPEGCGREGGHSDPPALSFPCSLYPVVPVNSRVVVDKEIEIGGFLFPKNVSRAGEPGFPGAPHRPTLMCHPTCVCRPSLCSATT